jgi:Cu+-exporting ATPase
LETTLNCQGTDIELRVGNEKFFKEHCVDKQEQQLLAPWIHTHQVEACTVVIPHINGRALGAIALRDKIQTGAGDVISFLKSRGIRVVMLTGDHNRTAQAIANEVGVDEVVSNALPSDKVECVKRCQEDGRVCMVGDGINDAPAMSQADLGVAIGAGSFLTTEAADVVLVRSDLKDFFAFYTLCRSTVYTIYRNFLWAFIFNFVSLPIAAGLFYPNVMIPPLYAGIAMGFSSVLVVTSSLLLRSFTPPDIHKKAAKKVQIAVPAPFRQTYGKNRLYEVAKDDSTHSSSDFCDNV